jgi:putative ABC transport system ATP-binding protein
VALEATARPSDVLVVENLRKTFRDDEGGVRLAVDVRRFRIGPGEAVALRGESGSGKTTFLNLVAGILQADAGRVFVAGREMTALPEAGRDRLRAETIGYVFQTFNLLQGYSALENVLLAMAFAGRVNVTRARMLLARVGLGERESALPRRLSAGQQQRVAIARALANQPSLVLADEPTANLDARNGKEALALMRQACAECEAALLLVSHDPSALQVFRRVEDLHEVNHAFAVEPDRKHRLSHAGNA